MQYIFFVFLFTASWLTIDGADIGKAVTTVDKPTPAECGQSSLPISKDKIVGANAVIGNFPWQVTTFQKDSDSGKWRPSCGGTLISTRAVLTVAHCFHFLRPENLNVALGKTNRDYYRNEPSEVKRAVKKIHIHELYIENIPTSANDIATLILDTEVEVSPTIMPACLDLLNIHGTHRGDGNIIEGFVMSWGDPSKCAGGCDIDNSQLTYSRVPTQDYNDCYKIANSINKRLASSIASDKLCADYVVYRGDSGAGLTFVFDNAHYVYGIASGKFSGTVDGKIQDHSIFVNVTHHIDWIKSHLS